MRPNQSDCRISNLNQSEGHILCHVTWPHRNVILRSGTEFRDWVWECSAKHGSEAGTGNDGIKPEINDIPRGLAKTHFLFNVLGSLEELVGLVELVGCWWCKENLQSK